MRRKRPGVPVYKGPGPEKGPGAGRGRLGAPGTLPEARTGSPSPDQRPGHRDTASPLPSLSPPRPPPMSHLAPGMQGVKQADAGQGRAGGGGTGKDGRS